MMASLSFQEKTPLHDGAGTTEIKTPLFHLFSGGTRPLTGGIPCRRLPDEQNRPKPGTLGYIATKVDSGDPVLLSCEHVFNFRRQDERLVFQPDYSKCSGIFYNDVGTVIDGIVNNVTFAGEAETFFIDAAIASVHEGIGTRKHITNVGNITGSGSIINAPTNPAIILKKVGAITDYTEGVVESVSTHLGPAQNFIKINPVAGKTFTYRERRKIHPDVVDQVLVDFPNEAFQGTATLVDPAEKIVEFVSQVFAIPGDSGAQLVNQTGQIVGMIFAGEMFEARAFHEETQRWRIVGVPKGPAYGCHIQPVLQHFGLRIDPSTGPTSGKQIVVPGALVSSEDPEKYASLSAKLEQLEDELQTTEQGQELIHLVQEHFREVVKLVHHCRQVKVVWHRLNGPAFAALFFRSISEPDRPFPREVHGIPVTTILQRMDQALSENGSSALNRSLYKHRDMIYHLFQSSNTINELLTHLKAECSVI